MNKSCLKKCVDDGMSSYAIAQKYNKSQTTIRYWLKKHSLETHRAKTKGASKSLINSISTDKLQALFNESSTWTEVINKLGFSRITSNRLTLLKRIERDSIDLTLFEVNCKNNDAKNLKKLRVVNSMPLNQILIKNSAFKGSNLKKRVIDSGLLKEQCSKCEMGPEWQGEYISLQLDHINGDHKDNRIENLRILCPNCHSQTKTWGSRNKIQLCSPKLIG